MVFQFLAMGPYLHSLRTKNDLTEFIPGDSHKSPGIPEQKKNPRGTPRDRTLQPQRILAPPSYMHQDQK